jgi:hypothetical protein
MAVNGFGGHSDMQRGKRSGFVLLYTIEWRGSKGIIEEHRAYRIWSDAPWLHTHVNQKMSKRRARWWREKRKNMRGNLGRN